MKVETTATAVTPKGRIVSVIPRVFTTSQHAHARTYTGGIIETGGVQIAAWNDSPFHNDKTGWSLEEALVMADAFFDTTHLEYAEEAPNA